MKKLNVSLGQAFPPPEPPEARLVDVKIPYSVWRELKSRDRARPGQRLKFQRVNR